MRSGAEHCGSHRTRPRRTSCRRQQAWGGKHVFGDGPSLIAGKGGVMTGASILIVEDEPALMRGLKDTFAVRGFDVITAEEGEAGLRAALDENPDLILLDIMLPKVNGYEICRTLRQQGLTMPILMLTAKGREEDVVLGLNLGADDYVTKPFRIRELVARVNAFLRRKDGGAARCIFGPFRLDLDAHKLFRDREEVDL